MQLLIAIQNAIVDCNTKCNCWLQYKMQLLIAIQNAIVDCNTKCNCWLQYKMQLLIAIQNAIAHLVKNVNLDSLECNTKGNAEWNRKCKCIF